MKIPSTPLNPIDAVTIQIPYYFRCPISLELMSDPVTVSTGQTYDRLSIESWISTGNTSCPVTRSQLTDFTLIPNHTLRRLIQEWCVAHRSFGVERIPTPKQPAEPSLVRSLLHQSVSGSSSVSARVSALRRVRSLAFESENNLVVISALNVRRVALSIIFDGELSDELRFEALAITSVFPPLSSDCSAIASDVNKVEYLVSLLFHPTSIEVRVNSASLIETVISGEKSPELRSDNVFAGVIAILNHPISYPRALKVGVKTLFALCLSKAHRLKAVHAGAPHALITRVGELDKCDCERALATIELLCRTPQGVAAFSSHELTIPILVKTILKVSDRATENATGALLALCQTEEGYGSKMKREAVNAGVLTQLLLVVQSGCTDRGKRKAQVLLKLLMESWTDRCNGISSNFTRNDIVAF